MSRLARLVHLSIFCLVIHTTLHQRKSLFGQETLWEGQVSVHIFVVFPCRTVQVSSDRKLNDNMLFSRLEPAETCTNPTLPPTDIASVRNDGGEGKPCLGGQTSQDLSIPQPPWKCSWKRHCTFLLDFRFRNVSETF